MLRLQGSQLPPLKYLPTSVQADLKAFWPTFKQASTEGESFLFNLGQPNRVREACQSARIGKIAGDALYFHVSYLEVMPAVVRLVVFAARRVVGDVEHDVIKVSLDGRNVSFLRYPAFDTDAHPSLEYSVRVHLPKFEHTFRDHRESENPPILHRKDSMVDELYPNYSVFNELSQAEERAGLLGRTDIGFRKQWLQLLTDKGFRIVGHQLMATLPAMVASGAHAGDH
jgi:DNA phosphorothioation-associated putative methyltransferase